ncbi:MAG: DUF2169 domain-containing protein [Byssovorax sp.]
MQIINTTPYVFLPLDTSPAPTMPALSLIVKATFALRHEQPALAVAKDAQQQLSGDEPYLDDLGRSLRYSNDLVPTKLRGEALVTATSYPPDGLARTACDVGIAIGPIEKTLRITGDRAWFRDANGQMTIGRAQPFESMQVRWERAFGGMNLSVNPMGRGIEAWPDELGRPIHHLPNIEYLDKHVETLKDRPPPAGFGPISPMWEPRAGRQGTRDQRWATFRAPLPPKDFDPLFYNAAPEDQQLPEGYFVGDEAVTLSGLHKELPVYGTSLPGKRLRLFLLIRQPKEAPSLFAEVEMFLDTVHIDVDAEQMVLLWRRPFPVASRAHTEIEACYITEEELADEPATLAAHRARFDALRGPTAPPLHEAVNAEVDAQVAEAKKVLRDGGVDPKLIAKLDGVRDPQEIFKILMDGAQKQTSEIERMTATFKKP